MCGFRRTAVCAVWLVLSACVPAVLSAADYADGNVRKNDNRWLNLNFFRTMHSADAFGPAYEGSYLEVEGGARSGALDFYFFYDAFDLLGMGTYKTRAGDFFTKIKPRFSLDALTGKDLAVGPVREWYLASSKCPSYFEQEEI